MEVPLPLTVVPIPANKILISIMSCILTVSGHYQYPDHSVRMHLQVSRVKMAYQSSIWFWSGRYVYIRSWLISACICKGAIKIQKLNFDFSARSWFEMIEIAVIQKIAI